MESLWNVDCVGGYSQGSVSIKLPNTTKTAGLPLTQGHAQPAVSVSLESFSGKYILSMRIRKRGIPSPLESETPKVA